MRPAAQQLPEAPAPPALVATLPTGVRLRQVFRPLVFRIWHPVHRFIAGSPRPVRLAGLRLFTHPEVFHPGHHFSSGILANYVATLPLQGRLVLDMGTGSGIIGIIAARRGASVIALDVNPDAAHLAAANAAAHGVAAAMRAVCGDLCAPLAVDLKFDWIIFNPPFYARLSSTVAQRAYHAGAQQETIARFLEQAGARLSAAGRIVMILSSDMHLQVLPQMLIRHGCSMTACESRPHLFEVFHLVQLRTT